MDRSSRFDHFVTDYARTLIRCKALELSHLPEFRHDDRADTEHEFWKALFAKAASFDTARASRNTFTDRVVASAAINLIRDARRQKRAGRRRARSLDAAAPSADPPAARVTAADLARRTGHDPADEVEAADTRDAVAHAVALAPAPVATFMRRVMGGTSIVAIARENDVSPYTVRKALRRAVPYLAAAGLDFSTSARAGAPERGM